MDGVEINFKETPARLLIIQSFDKAQAHLEEVASLLDKEGAEERAHKARNIAQQACAQKCLLAQDWSIKDAQRPAA